MSIRLQWISPSQWSWTEKSEARTELSFAERRVVVAVKTERYPYFQLSGSRDFRKHWYILLFKGGSWRKRILLFDTCHGVMLVSCVKGLKASSISCTFDGLEDRLLEGYPFPAEQLTRIFTINLLLARAPRWTIFRQVDFWIMLAKDGKDVVPRERRRRCPDTFSGSIVSRQS